MEPPLESLRSLFRERFGAPPTHLSRAPGRVNLIGEHTDYNGLPVFPMALQRAIYLLFRPREDGRVQVANAAPEFEPRSFELGREIPPCTPGDWGNYLKAPAQALARRLLDPSPRVPPGLPELPHPPGPRDLRGVDALVASDLPVASGLSSSSALVIALARALLHANGVELPALELAEAMARAERYTGTQGGGMDQAISLGGREGHACRIEFDPLRMVETPIPPGWRFVVAHTLVRAEKSGPAQAAYNQRRQECARALEMLGAGLREEGVVRGESKGAVAGSAPVTGDAPDANGGGAPTPDGAASPLRYPDLLALLPLKELLERARSYLPPLLLQRFRHVTTEAVRVYAAEEAMARNNLITFGLLMDASHQSLRDDYQVSSPELDRLVGLARTGGAAGARLTGAGFGGCVVALVDPRRLGRVLATLEKGYYRERTLPGTLDQVLFVAEAGPGAGVTEPF